MYKLLVVILSFTFINCISLNVAAQYLVDSKVTFGKILKFEQSKGSVKKADLRQGPLLKPGPPGMPEITVYKRAMVFQRVMGTDTLEAVYTSESDKKLEDASHVQTGEFIWRVPGRNRLMEIRDGLLLSLDGNQRTFAANRKKLKKGMVSYTYLFSDPAGFPKVAIDYMEKKRVPSRLLMRIDYNAVK